jgi:phenylalanyl-tRNA synthetase beta chain
VLDVEITTDRGYCLSIRGLARESAAALSVPFHELAVTVPEPDGGAYDISIEDPSGCDRFSARSVTGLDPLAPTPSWMAKRLRQSGMRPISLAVDVTNYVMLETGQPLHAFDRGALTGPIGVRRARPRERLITLDDVERTLDPADMVVTDDTGPIALAGVMGGASTEIGTATTDIVLEAAHWDPSSIARTSRRHKLPSEASRRFERGVDPEIAGVALQRCVDLLVEHGGATAVPGYTVVGDPAQIPVVALNVARSEQLAGMPIARDEVIAALEAVGCTVVGDEVLQVQPPTWRPDLVHTADLVEEVVRLVGYDKLPSVLPQPPAGVGLTPEQRLRRSISRAVADSGFVEVLSSPFVAPSYCDRFGIPAGDERRLLVTLLNPLSEAEPAMRTSLLPGLLTVLLRNTGRGERDVTIFETGLVFFASPDGNAAPIPAVDVRPSEAEIASLYGAIPRQPRHFGAVLAGDLSRRGWSGPARRATWADAIEVARVVARTARVELTVRRAEYAPWHPGRCAELVLDGTVIGHAGELHPGLITALGLPERTCATEFDLDAIPAPDPARGPYISTFPPVLWDVALVVASDVPAAEVEDAIRSGAGELLESVRLFDRFADDERLGVGKVSLAFELRLRATDRTLTSEEAAAARDAAIAAATERTGATLRS